MDRLETLRQRVRTFLDELGIDSEETNPGLHVLRYGSTIVTVSTFVEGNETFCRFATIMLTEFAPNLDLLQRLLRLNTEVLFGSFLLFEDDTLSFSATLLGNHLDADEFEVALRYVAGIADEFDDELQALGGGRRGADLLDTP
jgi:hypothetical protein